MSGRRMKMLCDALSCSYRKYEGCDCTSLLYVSSSTVLWTSAVGSAVLESRNARMRLKLGNNNCHLVGSVDERARVHGYAGTRAARSHRSSHCPSPSSGPFFAATFGDLHAELDVLARERAS
jgi:hypothetical protein